MKKLHVVQGCNEPDDDVLNFITSFREHEGEACEETIRHLFHAGYCYYFAEMLKLAFNRGSVRVAYPYGHIVWLDGDNESTDIAYDIEGVCCTEYEHLIPIELLGDQIESFMHVPGKNHYSTKEDIQNILKEYLDGTSYN